MSDNNIKIQVTKNTSEWINWIEEAIFKNNLKYYEYNDFHSIEKICTGHFGNFYRVKWKNSDQCFILKSFNLDNVTIKEIVHEVIFYSTNLQFIIFDAKLSVI
jgi:hypothetical protein